jgi:hypothetical protein
VEAGGGGDGGAREVAPAPARNTHLAVGVRDKLLPEDRLHSFAVMSWRKGSM